MQIILCTLQSLLPLFVFRQKIYANHAYNLYETCMYELHCLAENVV